MSPSSTKECLLRDMSERDSFSFTGSEIDKMWLKSNVDMFKEHSLTRVLFFIVSITSVVFQTLAHLLLYIVLRPFDKKLYRKVRSYLDYLLSNDVQFLVQWWSHSDYDLFVDPDVMEKYLGKERAITIQNHGKDIECVLSWVLADHFGVLGNYRGLMKKENLYIPFFGLCFAMMEHVFLERNWTKDKANYEKQMRRLTELEGVTWLLILAEGTRLSPEKIEISKRVSREKGLPELENVLLPRTKGFVSGVQILREDIAAVYDMTVVVLKDYEENASFSNLIKGKKLKFKLMLKRYPTSELPKDEEALAAWLHQRYQEKDRMVANVWRSGEFEPETGSASTDEMKKAHSNFKYVQLRRPIWTAVNFGVCVVIVLGSLLRYLVTALMNGNFIQLGIAFIVMQAASVGLDRFLDLTKTSKASSYGRTSSPR